MTNSHCFKLLLLLLNLFSYQGLDMLSRKQSAEISSFTPFSSTSFNNTHWQKSESLKQTIHESTMSALEEFFYALNGPFWTWLNQSEYGVSWNFTSNQDPCLDNWQGIGCNCTREMERHPYEVVDHPYTYYSYYYDDYIGTMSETCYIKKIFLANRNLTGMIPESIAEISNLTHLNLAMNNIYGTLTPILGELRYLEVLSLGGNSISGTIPSTFGSLRMMRHLRLKSNNMAGAIR
jgi:hypothetical protein